MSQMNILRPIGNVFVICALIWTGSRLIVETAGIVQLLAQPLFEAAVIQVKVEVETE